MYPGAHAASAPDKPAIVMAASGRTVTYGELEDNSARLASALHHLGLRKGDVVAMFTDNAPEAFEIYWAAMRSGLYVTPVNRHLAAQEAAYVMSASGAKVVIASAGVRARAEKISKLAPGIERWFAFGGPVDGHQEYAALLARDGLSTDQPIEVAAPGEPLIAFPELFDIGSDDVYLSSAPMYHTAPLHWCAGVQALGGTVVVLDRFDAEKALAAIDQYRVTVTQMLPTMFQRMLQLPEEVRNTYDMRSLRLVVHAAASCLPDVKDAMIDWWGPIFVEHHGASEQRGTTSRSVGFADELPRPATGNPANRCVEVSA